MGRGKNVAVVPKAHYFLSIFATMMQISGSTGIALGETGRYQAPRLSEFKCCVDYLLRTIYRYFRRGIFDLLISHQITGGIASYWQADRFGGVKSFNEVKKIRPVTTVSRAWPVRCKHACFARDHSSNHAPTDNMYTWSHISCSVA